MARNLLEYGWRNTPVPIDVSLPDSIRSKLESQARNSGCASESDYLIDLIQKDGVRARISRRDLRTISIHPDVAVKLIAGLASGQPVIADETFWSRLAREATA